MSDVAARQCYICLDTDPQDDVSQWISPCKCSGSLAWVHKACILRWIQTHNRSNALPVCSNCQTTYILTSKGPVVAVIEIFIDKIYPHFQNIVGVVAWNIGCSIVFVGIGLVVLVEVLGKEEVTSMIKNWSLAESIYITHLIFYFMMTINFSRWEDYLLAALRQASRLPVFGCFLPSEAPPQYYNRPDVISRPQIIVGSCVLPLWACLVGDIYFKSEKSNLRRFLIGGAVFLAVRGILYMYYKQKLLVRWKEMRILPYL